MKRILKTTGYIFSGLLISILVIYGLVISEIANPWIARKISSTAGHYFEGNLSINKIEGNLFSHFRMKGIEVFQQNEKTIILDEIEIDYQILKLLSRKVNLTSAKINGIQLFIDQDSNGIWNYEKLISNENGNIDSADTLPGSFNWEINTELLQIKSLEAFINTNKSTSIPRYAILNALLDFKIGETINKINFRQFDLNTKDPEFLVKRFNVNIEQSGQAINWHNLLLQLPKSTIKSEGSIPLCNYLKSEFSVNANPFAFEDLKGFIPGIYGSPDVSISIKNNLEKNNIEALLRQNNQNIKINGFITGDEKTPIYTLHLNADSINGAYWFQQPEFESIISGDFHLNGKGIDVKENLFNAEAKFSDIRYDAYNISGLQMKFEKEKSNLSGHISASTIFGDLVSQINVKDIFNLPSYDFELHTSKLDLSKFTSDKRLKSNLNITVAANGQGINLNTMRAEVKFYSKNSSIFENPITNLNAQVFLNNGVYYIKKIHLETPYLLSTISGNGNIKNNNQLNFSLDIKNIENITKIFGYENMNIEGGIKGNLTGPSNNLYFTSDLNLNWLIYNSLSLEGISANIKSRFYGNQLTWENLFSDSISHIQNFSPEKINLKARAHVNKGAYENFSLSEFSFEIEKITDIINGTFNTKTMSGDLLSEFKVSNLFSEPEYSIQSSLEHFNIAGLIPDYNIESDINLVVDANGKGLEPEALIAEIGVRSIGSTLKNSPISDFNATAFYNAGNYKIEGFTIETPIAGLNISGEGDIKNTYDISFNLSTKELKQQNVTLYPNLVQLNGNLEGRVSGRNDSLYLISSLDLKDFKYDTIRIKEIKAETNIQFLDSSYTGYSNIFLKDIKIQDLDIKNLQFENNFNNQAVNSNFSFFASDSLNGAISTILTQEKNPIIYIPKIDLNLYNNHWKNSSTNSFINLGKDSIKINMFDLVADKSSVKAHGVFAFSGTEDLQIDINNLAMINIPGLQLLPYSISGTVNASLDVGGTADKPKIKGFFNVLEPKVESLQFNKFYSTFNYNSRNLSFEGYIDDLTKHLAQIDIELPLHISFTENIFLPDKKNPINGRIKVDGIDLSQFVSFIPVKDITIDGWLSSDITLVNTIDSLQLEGGININKGAFTYKKFGMNYYDISLGSHFNNNRFILDSLLILSGKGKLRIKGITDLELPSTNSFNYISLQMTGKNFKAFDSELLGASINTRLSLEGTPENPNFSGNLNVIRSALNTDIFLKEYNRIYDTSEMPLLVQAQKNEIRPISFTIKNDSIKKTAPDIYKNLKGQFDIEIPGNTWVKGKNMNFELSGNLKVIKEGEQFDFFGTMNVKRGFYKIYGRRLDFEEGEITFTGKQLTNPSANFLIGYKFRDQENILRKLNVNIKGRVSKPEILFTIDDDKLEEKEAISYLVFNKSLEQLDTREHSTLKNSNLNIARELAISQVSNLVKDALQSTLGLDVIEISGKKGWSEGSVSIGKYITNNLYLNYERNFALDKKDKLIEPEKISLEYQFLRSLFLQATNQRTNSGFDFIIKKTWK